MLIFLNPFFINWYFFSLDYRKIFLSAKIRPKLSFFNQFVATKPSILLGNIIGVTLPSFNI